MKKFFAVLVVLLVAFAVFANGANEGAKKVAKIDIASLYTDGTVCDDACISLMNKLNASGLFEVKYYNNSQLGSLYDQIESLLSGTPIIALGGGSDWGDRVNVPLMGVVMTPFLYDKLSDVYGVTTQDYWKQMLKDAEASGVKILNFPIVSGSRYFMGNKKVLNPADFEGLKIRVPNSSAYLNAFTAFHATPVAMPVADLYTALSQKLVDGLEHPYANAYSQQYHEVVKYAADIPYVTTFDFFGISLKYWNNLTAEQQSAFEKALAEVCDEAMTSFAKGETAAKQKLADKGMQFYTPNADAFRACMPKFYELCNWTDSFKKSVEDGMTAWRKKN